MASWTMVSLQNLMNAAGHLLQACVRGSLATLGARAHFVIALDVSAIAGAG